MHAFRDLTSAKEAMVNTWNKFHPGGRCHGTLLERVLEKLGVKVQGGLGEVQNEDLGPRGAIPEA